MLSLSFASSVAGCLLIVDTDGLHTGTPDAVPGDPAILDAAGAETDESSTPDRDAATDSMSYAEMILADMPVAYFRLGDLSVASAVDASGHENHGVYLAGTVLGVLGAIAGDSDTAVNTQKGGVSAPESLDFSGTAPFSLEAWAKFTSVGSFQHLFNKDSDPTSGPEREQFGVVIDSSKGLVFERHVAGVGVTVETPVPSAREYHHIVSTYDGAKMALYLDATLAGVTVDARSQKPKPVPFLVGTRQPGANRWPGVIDEVAVYDRALSAADIERHFAKGRGQ